MRTTAVRKPAARSRGWLRDTLLVAFTLLTVTVPIWVVLVNSMKSDADAANVTLGLPKSWHVAANYNKVLKQGHLLRGVINTTMVALPAIAAIIFFGSLAAWIFARTRRVSVAIGYYVTISGILLPPAIVATIRLLRFIGVQGSLVGLSLFYIGTMMSLGVFLITGFVKTIPVEFEEAAKIDGASQTLIFLRIIMPLLRPVLATASFVLLLFMWNDFYSPYYLVNGSKNQTLILGLYDYVNSRPHGTAWELVFANVVLASIPLIVLFVVLQRRIVSGLMGTMLK